MGVGRWRARGGGAFHFRLGIGKKREPKLIDVRWTKESHSVVAEMWMEREQKCLHIKLEQRGWRREDGGVGMEREMESVPMRMWRNTG